MANHHLQDGTGTRWKEVVPFLRDAALESAPSGLPDRDVRAFVMNGSNLLLEMGSSDSAPRKEDHFAALASCTKLKDVL